MTKFKLHKRNDYIIAGFSAMASPCEVLVDSTNPQLAHSLAIIAMDEAKRIENKFSRYQEDNIIFRINHSEGQETEVDEETANLLDYADQCYNISDGLFDITSGVLRKIWTFDGSDKIAEQDQINKLLERVGWNKVGWARPRISLPSGMEIDFGGIGKEYAVDQSAALIANTSAVSCLINFGGDIRSTGLRSNGQPWVIGIENPGNLETTHTTAPNIKLAKGAVATSGDTRRYLIKDGIRYAHVINPKTGWPVTGGPRSITVAAHSCTEAGMLATLALLHGKNAEEFLQLQNTDYWCEW